MRKTNLLIFGLTVSMFANCGGGGAAASNLVKWRNEGKNLAIVCDIKISKPGKAYETQYGTVVQDAKMGGKAVRFGEWNATETALYKKWANNQCQDLLTFLKKSVNYSNVEIVDPNTVPKKEGEFFGMKNTYADYSQTRFDYIWLLTIEATKKVEATGQGAAEKHANFKCGACANFITKVRAYYHVEDWSDKNSSAKSVPFQDLFFATGGNGFGTIKDFAPNFDKINESDFIPLTEDYINEAQSKIKSKYDNIQKKVDELNAKKK